MSTNTAENLENEVEETTEIEVEIEEAPVEQKQEVETKVEESKPEATEEVEAENSDTEIDKYSAGVQKRIDQLTKKYRDEEKAREEALQLREEAVKYAQQVKDENEKLRKSLEDNETVLIDQAKGRVEAQIAQANVNYKTAYEAGDPDKLLEAQSELTRLQNEQYRVSTYKAPKRQEPAPLQQQPEPQEQAPQVQEPSGRGKQWLEDNKWFHGRGDDNLRMTGFAYGVHEELINKGVAPDSEEYYTNIDTAMRQVFPTKFEVTAEESATPQPQAGNVVAPPSRTSKKPRKVKLTPTAAALAKRLGLTAEQYAAQLMKDS